MRVTARKKGFARIRAAFFFSIAGLRTCYQSEAAFRQEAILFLLLLPVLLVLPVSLALKLILLAANVMVLITELLNSAIETVVNLVSPDYHELAGQAKDVSSAAVFLALLLTALLWLAVISAAVL